MTKNDKPFIHHSDIGLAFALLTRLPLRVSDASRCARAAWAYSLVGFFVGVLSALTGLFSLWIGLPTALAALLALAAQVGLTGALHEDGLADTADGFWGGWDKANRLKIMKDSHIGSYGVLALLFAFTARLAAYYALFEADPKFAACAIIASATLSRAMMPALMASLPHARNDGLSHSVGAAGRKTALLGFAIAALATLVLTGTPGLAAIIAAVVSGWAVAAITRAKIGGQTGDVLGATQQISEIAILLSFTA